MVSFGGMPSREELAQAVINVLCEKFDVSPAPKLVINGRMGMAMGRAYKYENEIHVNPLVLNSDTLGDVVKHEVAHFVAFKKGDNAHGAIWKQCAINCGAIPLARHHIDAANPLGSVARYQLSCGKGCNAFFNRKPRLERICKKHGLKMPILNIRVQD